MYPIAIAMAFELATYGACLLYTSVPGFAANETLLYSPELKFYSNKVKMDENLDTNIDVYKRQILYCVVVTVQIFLVYFCFNMLYHGTNVGLPMWVATVLNLVLFHMLFAYMWPQVVLLDQPFHQTLKNCLNCMIAFLPHALASAIVTILFWGVVILCMPLGIFLMLIFGFWFQTEVCCQIVYGDVNRVFHIEESLQKLHDAELDAALREEYGEDEPDGTEH